MLWLGLFNDWRDALNLFAVKRVSVSLSHSQERYLNYISLIGSSRHDVNSRSKFDFVTIKSVIMNGIPLFTKIRLVVECLVPRASFYDLISEMAVVHA